MITTKIEVPPHLKEYLIGKFCNMQDSPIHFPDKTDIYHIIYDLLERRPINIPPIELIRVILRFIFQNAVQAKIPRPTTV